MTSAHRTGAPDHSQGPPWLHWVAALFLVATALTLVVWTWGAWTNPVTDSGRELHVAWRLSLGEVLYRDMAYFNGPLSPYWNAVWFKLFGPGLHVLTVVNMLVGAGIIGLTHAIVQRIRGVRAATLASLALLILCAIPPRGPYTFLAPYSHEMTHGLLLVLLLVYALCRHCDSLGRGWLIMAGVAAGAALLTKPEIGLAAVAVVVAWIVRGSHTGEPGRSAQLLTLHAAAAVPLGVALIAMIPALGLEGALRGLLAPVSSALNAEVRELPFYRMVMGSLDPGAAIRRVVLGTSCYLMILGVPFLALRRLAAVRADRVAVALLIPAAVLGLIIPVLSVSWITWWRVLAPLQVFVVVVLLGEITGRYRCLSAGRGPSARRAAELLGVLAAALLLKIFLNVNVLHYGFTLAAPSVAILVAVTCGTLPESLGRTSRLAGRVYAVYAIALLLGVSGLHLAHAAQVNNNRSFHVGSGWDRVRMEPGPGRVLDELLDVLDSLPPGDRVVSVPEGAGISYLARRASGVPFPTILPAEQVIFGSAVIDSSFAQARPEWVTTWDRPNASYGTFGQDYGVELSGWVAAHYHTVWSASYTRPSLESESPDTVTVRLLKLTK
jgi:hypothetical protein